MIDVEEILERVAEGESSVTDAEALRRLFALEAVKRVAGGGLQDAVYRAVCARGYRDGFSSQAFVTRQFLKALEELGECARCLFDERMPPPEEVADVVIPLLAAAEELGMDLDGAIRRKVREDIARGVRVG